MKKLFLFFMCVCLAACGGGSGGSGSFVPGAGGGAANIDKYATGVGQVDENAKISNQNVVRMDSSVYDENGRTAYLKSVFGEDEYNKMINEMMGNESAPDQGSWSASRSATVANFAAKRANDNQSNELKNVCKNTHDCNQAIFDNMLTVLQNIDNLESYDWKDIRNALIAAGYKGDLSGMTDDIKQWIKNNQNEIKDIATNQGYYNLENAAFSALTTTGVSDILRMWVDDSGEIEAIQFVRGDHTYNPEAMYKRIERDGNSNEFKFAANNQITGGFIVNSYAKNLGLSYADFGVITTSDGSTYNGQLLDNVAIPYAGGYMVKNIDKTTVTDSITFNGTAAGMVEAPNSVGGRMDIRDDNATLVLASGSETLSAKFDNWYNVTVVNNFNYGNRIGSVTFYGGDNISDEKFELAQTGNVGTQGAYFESGYFGDDGKPSEAVALFQYQQNVKPSDRDNGNVNLFMGFGGKTQQQPQQ